jgi:predicted HicB family RNase H-like nuclease
MNYQGYTARIEFDERDGIFWGKVLGIKDSITFEGETVAQLTQDFHNAIDFYLADCAAIGKEPQKPASGKLMLRIPPELHAAALVKAQAVGKSLNQCAIDALSREVGV